MPVPVLTSTNSAAASTEISAPGLASSAFRLRIGTGNITGGSIQILGR